MQKFFTVVFGGMFAVITGIGVAATAGFLWQTAIPALARIHVSTLTAAAATLVSPEDGTSISGMHRIIRYTAFQEEDQDTGDEITAAAGAAAASGAINASGYIIKNLDTGEVIAEHNADTAVPIASLSKLIAAAVAKKLIADNDRITITRDIVTTYGNTAQFGVGETFLAKDLYYPLLMVSSNDAAEAFARHYGRKAFIGAMNDFAQSIGAYRTYFADPSGLSAHNVSTPGDLAIILDWLRKHDPDIIATTALKSETIAGHTWINPTHFLNWSNYVGGKNGYTPEADRTAASLFALGHSKDTYAVIVLGSNARDDDEFKLLAKVGK